MEIEIKCEHREMLPVSKLKKHPKNPNKHSSKQIERLARLIEYQGFRHPVIVSNQTGFIVAGHGRLQAAKKLKMKDVPVDYQDFENEDKEYAFLVSDNSIADWAELDLADINLAVPDLGPDFDIDMLGIDGFEIDFADRHADKEEIEDNVPEVKESICKPGELWILGEHRLLCGDATSKDDVDKLMAGQKADMVFTDPPYGVNYEGGHFHSGDVNIKRKREKLKSDDSTSIYKEIIPIICYICDGPCYTWFADTKSLDLIQSVNSYGDTHAMIIWHKTNATYAAMNSQYKQRHEPCLYWKPKGKTLKWNGSSTENTLWEMKKDGKNNFHPTQKPVELAERAIKNHKAPKVLDLFGGSGSTLIACEKTNRKCYMMEIDSHYCDVIIKRWEEYSGKKARKEEKPVIRKKESE